MKYSVKCYAPIKGNYIPIESLNATQRGELSQRIVWTMGAAIQNRVNRCPAEYREVTQE